MIELQDVSKSYAEGDRRHRVLHDVSARFDAGQSVALVGRSGSGKSTLLNLISGIDSPDSGHVHLLEHDLGTLDDAARTRLRRAHIGFVFQFFNLLPALSVIDNVCLPQCLNGVSLRRARDRAATLLARVGLADRHDSFADRLSGGEQQRVAIARAIAHDPAVVLADEPTGNLDEATAADVLALLESLVRDEGRILIMATHAASAAAICRQSVRIVDGTLQHERVPAGGA